MPPGPLAISLRRPDQLGEARQLLRVERRVHIGAARFAFSVSEIEAKRGETLVIALTSTDFVHGFSLPDLKARIDVPPGKGVELTLRYRQGASSISATTSAASITTG